jgi:putative ubiquitin-RnfH superfamily antitoxin RatB of RatAB toxin-antitoxin module
VFSHIANTFVDSFVKRAGQIYRAGQVLNERFINVEVCTPCGSARRSCTCGCPKAAPCNDAVEASGLFQKHPEIQLAEGQQARGSSPSWSRLDTECADKDRVEIYRPLIADPKEVRKQACRRGQGHEERGRAAEEAEC